MVSMEVVGRLRKVATLGCNILCELPVSTKTETVWPMIDALKQRVQGVVWPVIACKDKWKFSGLEKGKVGCSIGSMVGGCWCKRVVGRGGLGWVIR